jgi:3,4-dihydroxy 2-butanone 4-phosphate synthase/GTP cyclohydrolase II
VEAALAEIAAGRPVVVVDDEGRENEGDLIMAADAITPEWMAFIVRYSSGLVCLPMTGGALDRLGIPAMVPQNEDRMQTAFAVSVDARSGISTGISARDRARTARLLADPGTQAGDLVRPGHLLPLRARDGGVLVRPGHTEAAVDLARLAGREPAGVIAELVEDDGSMRRSDSCRAFADEHHLLMISIEDLREHRRRIERLVRRIVATRMPTAHGVLTAVGYSDGADGDGHLALVAGLDSNGRISDGEDVLVRVHSECLTGDVLSSQRCDCGPQLDASIRQVADAGRGVVVYLRGHEGRGIGLLAKLQAYALQDRGLDTVDANTHLGLPVDAREYVAAADILSDLGVRSVRLLTNNPAKVEALQRYGIRVSERIPLVVTANSENVRYLATKRDRMGHHLVGSVSAGRTTGTSVRPPARVPPAQPAPTSGLPSDTAINS